MIFLFYSWETCEFHGASQSCPSEDFDHDPSAKTMKLGTGVSHILKINISFLRWFLCAS